MTYEDDRAWYEMHRSMVDRAVATYVGTGEWPLIDDLQRDLDRLGLRLDVRGVTMTMPTSSDVPRLAPTQVVVPLRIACFSPAVEPVIDVCVAIVQRAVDLYLSNEPKPTLHSDDVVLQGLTTRPALLFRAMRLVAENWPDPLGSRGGSESGWWCEVDGTMARRFAGIRTSDDYLDRQEEIREEFRQAEHRFVRGSEPSTRVDVRRRLFVLMPFGRPWSNGVYDLIKRASASVVDGALDVYRADDINDPGVITEQIEAAIREAAVVVADITDVNPNVMYELGYAKAHQKPLVILNQHPEDSPFDLKTLRQQRYNATPTADDETRIAQAITAALP